MRTHAVATGRPGCVGVWGCGGVGVRIELELELVVELDPDSEFEFEFEFEFDPTPPPVDPLRGYPRVPARRPTPELADEGGTEAWREYGARAGQVARPRAGRVGAIPGSRGH